MSSSALNRRRLLQAAGVATLATAAPALVPSLA
ncbi:MAG: twin-arginine translocation signal domain-containing protein, partial [Saccharothrix sp.]|nr:twin-arginine translocation signal domain-containing protein [Saccharothrix sp.]